MRLTARNDMDYESKLDRAMEQSPDIDTSADRLEVPDVDVRQEGNVTVVENFQELATVLDRDPDHVLRFLQNELGTAAHIDESDRGRFTGDFGAGRIATAIDAYVERFVRCSECGLPDTKLEEEQGATVLRCEACGALSSTSE